MAWKPCATALCCLGLAAAVSPPVLRAHVEPMSVREIVAASPHIVVATVEGRRSRWNELRTLILTDYTLRVEERLRGAAPDRITLTVPGGTLGTLADDTCISVHLEVGARYLLFLGDLGRPTLTPVTGAGQGMVREMPGAPNTFRDLVGAVRSLEERIPLAPPSSSPPAGAELPAKTWSPAAPKPPKAVFEKYLYHELAPRPVVVNPLTDSPFAPWDQYEMAYWNRYSGDLFRVLDPPAPTWAYNNGVSDMVGFPDDTVMKRQFGYDWTDLGDGVVGVTFARREEGLIVEADVAFNPHKSWTLDDLVAGGQDKIYSFKEACLHELGHVWGLNHPFDDDATVTWDSVMDYKPRQYWVGELFADDTAAVRHAFPPGVPIRDGLISSYVTVPGQVITIIPDYKTATPSPSTVRAGGVFSLAGPIKIENVGTVPLVNPVVEVYLAPARLSFEGAVLVQRATVRGKILSGGTLQVKLKNLKVPRGTPAGTYYLGYFLRDPKDSYQDNNAAWSLDGVTVTVTP